MDYVLNICLHLFPLQEEIIQHTISEMRRNIKLYALILIYITTRVYHRNELFKIPKRNKYLGF